MTTKHSWTDAQCAEIAEELDCILTDARFASSQRCVTLLRYLVEHALAGNLESVKERTLGIDVYGRQSDYDSNADPIVRRTAREIRKRLELHYRNPEYKSHVRIHLMTGSYVPQFDFESQELAEPENECKELSEPLPEREPVVQHPVIDISLAQRGRWRGWLLSGAAILLVCGSLFVAFHSDLWRPTGFLIWKPFLDPKQDLIVCVSDRDEVLDTSTSSGAEPRAEGSAAGESGYSFSAGRPYTLPRILFMDSNVAFQIAGWISARGKTASLRPYSWLKLREFREKPVVSIGGFNNPWSLMFLSKLRYSLHADQAIGERWIEDSQNPSKRDWKIDGSPEHSNVDYALISRYWDSETGQWVMVLSGLGPYGTEAAANLLTASSLNVLLPRNLRSARNFQIVLRVVVIGGSAGSPQILSVHTW